MRALRARRTDAEAWDAQAEEASSADEEPAHGPDALTTDGSHLLQLLVALHPACSDEEAEAMMTVPLDELSAELEALRPSSMAKLSDTCCSRGVLSRLCKWLATEQPSLPALVILAHLSTSAVNPNAGAIRAALKSGDAISLVAKHLFSDSVPIVALACAVCANLSANDSEVRRTCSRTRALYRPFPPSLAIRERRWSSVALSLCPSPFLSFPLPLLDLLLTPL